MFSFFKKEVFFIVLLKLLFTNLASAEIISEIKISGNERISDQTIQMFSKVSVNENIDERTVNEILKNLYDSNYFSQVNVKFENNILKINVSENPIIYNIKFEGLKSKSLQSKISDNLTLKERSSYNEFILSNDKKKIISVLREMGYFFSNVEIFKEELADNKLDLIINIDLGKKSKIKKISFLGDKKFKNRKLINIIVSEEFKFWKFLSGKKYLNESVINLDKRLLKNFYLNQGYYNVAINSSFAKLINENEFELIYNINANDKFYFGDLKLDLPNDYEEQNFIKIINLFKKLSGSVYSINKIDQILEEIDSIVLNEQYEAVNATVNENISSNKLNLTFVINETEKLFVERINIFGNNVTSENVIRNKLLIDEGDPFNEILENKSINNIKSLNFFRSVKSKVIPGKDQNSKIINITVDEKPTGEIMAGAGFGTSGTSFLFGIKENNFLGKGIALDANLNLGTDTVKGQFVVNNPNYKNSDKSLSFSLLATEIDRLKESGYKTNKTGLSLGTRFEYYDDLFFRIGGSSFYERLETDSTASATQKTQEGNYFDTFLKLDFDYDKRNQKFQTNKGFRSKYSIDLPLISETYTLSNSYSYKHYTELYENNISAVSFLFKSALSVNNEDIKLSERIFIPSNSLRGFEAGKVGPKDGSDYIGGNFVSSFNFSYEKLNELTKFPPI